MIELQTPCFVLEEDKFNLAISGFRTALTRYFPNNRIGYSVKTNSLPAALTLAKKAGCDAEVVSHDEYELARACGYTPDRIIYNGPMKSKETFIEALVGGAVVNIETQREIEWLGELPENKNFNIGIRLNVDIMSVSPNDAKTNEEFSRFGFCFENGELAKAIERINLLPNVTVSGLHIHRTSKTRSVDFYRHLITYALSVADSLGLQLNWLDVGGSYYGIFPNAPTFEDYAKAFQESIPANLHRDGLTIIVEPGNAIAAASFYYLSTVIDVKHLENITVVTTDGSRNDVDPLFTKTDYLKEIMCTHKSNEIISRQYVCGATCLEFDRLFELKDFQPLRPGDIIKYNNIGAYTMCLTPMFINYFPRVYLKHDNKFTLIRDKWTANDYLTKSNTNI